LHQDSKTLSPDVEAISERIQWDGLCEIKDLDTHHYIVSVEVDNDTVVELYTPNDWLLTKLQVRSASFLVYLKREPVASCHRRLSTQS